MTDYIWELKGEKAKINIFVVFSLRRSVNEFFNQMLLNNNMKHLMKQNSKKRKKNTCESNSSF